MTTPASLLDGYRRFRAGTYHQQRDRFDALAGGQAPEVMIVSCCDSRVEPAMIFDRAPGDAFVLRNVANLVPPFETTAGLHGVSAAIEFAVLGLKVRHILVLGHGACGGIAASLAGGADLGPEAAGFVGAWMGALKETRDRVVATDPQDPQRALEHEGVRTSLANLRSFPYVATRERNGTLSLHGGWFAIGEGRLEWLDEATGRFEAVDA